MTLYLVYRSKSSDCWPHKQRSSVSVSNRLRGNVALNKTVKHVWSHAVVDRTRDFYYVGYSHFEKFLLLNGVQWFRNLLPPISENILIFFVAHCFDTLKLQHSTIKLYLCGIRYQYMKFNSTNPFETSDKNYLSRLSLILKSAKRLQ